MNTLRRERETEASLEIRELTIEQLKSEQDFIGNMTLAEYIKVSRVGRTFRLSRAMRKKLHNNIDNIIENMRAEYHEEKRESMKKRRLTPQANYAYNSICKYRDEVMLETA